MHALDPQLLTADLVVLPFPAFNANIATSPSDATSLHDDDNEYTSTVGSKRQRVATAKAQQRVTKKARTVPSDKDVRKVARMVRNREAAQASRDRKKEHVSLLEARVAELEAELTMSPSRSSRSPSIAPSTSSSASQIDSLTSQNDVLKTQLALEQAESAQLRTRLSDLETRFFNLELLLSASLSSLPFPPLVEVADHRLDADGETSSRLVAAEAGLPQDVSTDDDYFDFDAALEGLNDPAAPWATAAGQLDTSYETYACELVVGM